MSLKCFSTFPQPPPGRILKLARSYQNSVGFFYGFQHYHLKDNNSEKKQGCQLIPPEYLGQTTSKFGYYTDGLLKHSSLTVQEKAFVLPGSSLENEN